MCNRVSYYLGTLMEILILVEINIPKFCLNLIIHILKKLLEFSINNNQNDLQTKPLLVITISPSRICVCVCICISK